MAAQVGRAIDDLEAVLAGAAMSLVEVSRLPLAGLVVEVEATAVR